MEPRQATRMRPAWKEPMLWLVVAIPAASVLASVALLVAAARSSGNDDAVADRVQRTAQIQVSDLAPDLAARELGLGATLRVDGGRISVTPATGAFPRESPLQLALRHPTRAEDDVRLELQPSTEGWSTQYALSPAHDWALTLSPVDGHWRLQGRLPRGRHGTDLQPSLDSR